MPEILYFNLFRHSLFINEWETAMLGNAYIKDKMMYLIYGDGNIGERTGVTSSTSVL